LWAFDFASALSGASVGASRATAAAATVSILLVIIVFPQKEAGFN
jgi:hypothetical protein